MKFQLLFCSWMCIFFSIPANGVHIEFYKNANYTDLMFESNSTAKCNNIKERWVYSIKTDTCTMIYYLSGCKSRSKKILPGRAVYSQPESFHICNDEEGGPQLRLDITELYAEQSQAPEILESYKNLCSCVNVPESIQKMANWSINNHGNDLFAYYEPDCSQIKFSPLFVPAGQSDDSWGIYRKTKTDGNAVHKIQSFGPDLNSTYSISCLFNQTEGLESSTDKSTLFFNNLQASPNLTSSLQNEHLNNVTNKLTESETHEMEYQVLSKRLLQLEQAVQQSAQSTINNSNIVNAKIVDLERNLTEGKVKFDNYQKKMDDLNNEYIAKKSQESDQHKNEHKALLQIVLQLNISVGQIKQTPVNNTNITDANCSGSPQNSTLNDAKLNDRLQNVGNLLHSQQKEFENYRDSAERKIEELKKNLTQLKLTHDDEKRDIDGMLEKIKEDLKEFQ